MTLKDLVSVSLIGGDSYHHSRMKKLEARLIRFPDGARLVSLSHWHWDTRSRLLQQCRFLDGNHLERRSLELAQEDVRLLRSKVTLEDRIRHWYGCLIVMVLRGQNQLKCCNENKKTTAIRLSTKLNFFGDPQNTPTDLRAISEFMQD